MRNTPILLHDHDEFIPIDVFLEGIDVYEKIIPVLANATE
jgi:aminoacylase